LEENTVKRTRRGQITAIDLIAMIGKEYGCFYVLRFDQVKHRNNGKTTKIDYMFICECTCGKQASLSRDYLVYYTHAYCSDCDSGIENEQRQQQLEELKKIVAPKRKRTESPMYFPETM
jgi:hypothetical protein